MPRCRSSLINSALCVPTSCETCASELDNPFQCVLIKLWCPLCIKSQSMANCGVTATVDLPILTSGGQSLQPLDCCSKIYSKIHLRYQFIMWLGYLAGNASRWASILVDNLALLIGGTILHILMVDYTKAELDYKRTRGNTCSSINSLFSFKIWAWLVSEGTFIKKFFNLPLPLDIFTSKPSPQWVY